MNLTEEQIERYSRHIILRDVGGAGQEKLLNASVLIIGAGGLGSPAALYLAAAGIGRIGLIDGDVVDMSNLQRQVIHHTPDIGRPKVKSAAEKMRAINPDITVETFEELFLANNALDIIKEYDFVIDGTDNFEAKFLINDACVMGGKPFSHGGILRFEGQTLTYDAAKRSACYRCIFNSPPPKDAVPSCSQAGVLGVLAGVLGTLQATEAVKYILGIGETLTNRLMVYDGLAMTFRNVPIRPNKNCPICSENATITELVDEAPAVCDLKAGQ